jgi:hypothetical protein
MHRHKYNIKCICANFRNKKKSEPLASTNTFYISPTMYNIVFILLRHTRKKKHIGGKIVRVLSSSEAYRVFVLSSSEADRVKPKTITLVFVASPLSTQHPGERAKTDWLKNRKKRLIYS